MLELVLCLVEFCTKLVQFCLGESRWRVHSRSGVCYTGHSKHLLVFKTYWRRLQQVFIVTVFHLPRRLQDVFNTSWRRFEDILQDVFKTSWKTKNCYAEDVFKTSWRKTKCLLGISVYNKSKCVYNKSIFKRSISGESKANPKSIN